MSILPGGSNMIGNTIDILRGNQKRVDDKNSIDDEEEYRARLQDFKALGDMKVQRFEEYWKLFPELAGRFVFVGDDGQADLLAAEKMLGMTDENGLPLVAFCAIHAVCPGPKPLVPSK